MRTENTKFTRSTGVKKKHSTIHNNTTITHDIKMYIYISMSVHIGEYWKRNGFSLAIIYE